MPREGKDCPAAQRDHTLSGFCVPRWVSLKRGEVYGRKGAGKDYPALWIYRVKGLPVQVVAETTDWRRICDPDGGATWVHRSMIDGRRIGDGAGSRPCSAAQAASGHRPPRWPSSTPARWPISAIARADGARSRSPALSGWAPADKVWGTAAARQCR